MRATCLGKRWVSWMENVALQMDPHAPGHPEA